MIMPETGLKRLMDFLFVLLSRFIRAYLVFLPIAFLVLLPFLVGNNFFTNNLLPLVCIIYIDWFIEWQIKKAKRA